jgi:Secretion system C-terminal sorting domain
MISLSKFIAMKKIVYLIILLCALYNCKAQITYEATYQNAALFYPSMPAELGIVNLGSQDYKYYLFNKTLHSLKLYDLNHSLYLTVNVPAISSSSYLVQYISRSLFDCDSTTIEYLINGFSPNQVKIYRTDGTLLLAEDSAHAYSTVSNAVTVERNCIRTTPAGTKMMLDYDDGTARIFALCGSLPCPIDCGGSEGGSTSVNQLYNTNSGNPYPNPSSNQTHIPYHLPQGEPTGEIIFYDLAGAEVKRYKVDTSFTELILTASDLAAGSYYYQLQTPHSKSEGKKLVVIK